MNSKKLMILFVCFVMMAAVALANKVPTVTRIDPTDHQDMTILTPPGDGIVGNCCNDIDFSIYDWLEGDEEYKYFFNPSLDLPDCPAGFQLLTSNIVLRFPPDLEYPYEFSAYGDLESAVWDEVLGCYVPGSEEYAGPLTTITIPYAGLWGIELPMPDCECAFIFSPDGEPYMYMLSFHFVGPVTAALITDEFPMGCTSWNNQGDGWVDLVNDIGFPGELIMFGNANCCDNPVAVEDKSWGGIKSLYR